VEAKCPWWIFVLNFRSRTDICISYLSWTFGIYHRLLCIDVNLTSSEEMLD
jgi:hypothetical protein